MRTQVLILLALTSLNARANDPVDPHKQIVIKPLSTNELVVDGTPMVAAAWIGAYGFTWDTDFTTYLTNREVFEGSSKLRLSEVGAAAGDRIIYRGWPYLLNNRGQLFAIDDSRTRDILAKLERYKTFTQFGNSAWRGVGVGAILTIALLLDRNIGQEMAVFSPNTSAWFTFFGGWVAEYLVEAGLSLRKSHRELGHGGNFFKKLLASNVISVTPKWSVNGQTLNPNEPNDYEIKIQKGKKGIVENKMLSDLISSTNPNAPKYRFLTCNTFLIK